MENREQNNLKRTGKNFNLIQFVVCKIELNNLKTSNHSAV